MHDKEVPMALYKNKKTGTVVDFSCNVSGADWEKVAGKSGKQIAKQNDKQTDKQTIPPVNPPLGNASGDGK
jgi:hypothetical protein